MVAYRVDTGRVRRMLRLIEDDVEMGALCWTGRAIHSWVRALTARKGGDNNWRWRLGRLGVHYVCVENPQTMHFAVAPPRVMLSQAWDVPVPWEVEGEGGRRLVRGATVEPPWGVV